MEANLVYCWLCVYLVNCRPVVVCVRLDKHEWYNLQCLCGYYCNNVPSSKSDVLRLLFKFFQDFKDGNDSDEHEAFLKRHPDLQ